jgi:hypothetical protein
MLEIMKKLETSRGNNVLLPTKMGMSTVDKFSTKMDGTPYGYELHQRLRVGTVTVVDKGASDEEYEHLNHRAVQMFCEELYGEVAQDLYGIIRHVYENNYDTELMQMIDALLRKVRP